MAAHHDETHPLPGRDLSGLVRGTATERRSTRPIYFMTEDDVTRGVTQVNILNGTPFEPVTPPTNIESVITSLPTGDGRCRRVVEVEPLLRAPRRLVRERKASRRIPFLPPAAEPQWELHNLTVDPEERHNRAHDDVATLSTLQSVLETERDAKRLIPRLRNATP